MIEQTCQTCGKKFHRKPSQAGKFCSYQCKYEADKVFQPRKCVTCGKEFYPSTDKQKNCSRACLGKYSVRENNPNWRGGAERVCEECGKPFYAKPSSGQRFCSKNCKYEHGRTTVKCLNCGKEFRTRKFIFFVMGRKFCSQKCNRAYHVGERHFAWQAKTEYPPTFNGEFRTMIRKRDNYTCAICKRYGRSVHHINYVKADTNPENCITLCNSCHSKTNHNRSYWITYFATLSR